MEILIVTGMSGAGKTQVGHILEDLGYYCIDNMPPRLIPIFSDMVSSRAPNDINKIAMITDTRGGDMFPELFTELQKIKDSGMDYKILFLDATDETLIKRYRESRRKHPLMINPNDTVMQALAKEREILDYARKQADYLIDTTDLNGSTLRERVTREVTDGARSKMTVAVMSFGTKYGLPNDADLMFDVRCFPNPFYVESLKKLTGLDKEVRDYVMKFSQMQTFIGKLTDMLDFLLPLYEEEGKSRLVIAIGCTGGKHRSVTVAEYLHKYMTERHQNSVIYHRDLHKD